MKIFFPYIQDGIVAVGSFISIVALTAMGLTVKEQQKKINSLERQFFEFRTNLSVVSELPDVCTSVRNFVGVYEKLYISYNINILKEVLYKSPSDLLVILGNTTWQLSTKRQYRILVRPMCYDMCHPNCNTFR